MKKKHVFPTCLSILFLFLVVGCQTMAGMNETANISRGWRDHRRGLYEEAVTNFNAVLQENPQSAHAYFGLAVAWEDKGDFVKAKEYYLKTVALDLRYPFLF